MIKEDFYYFGKITKKFGYKGELVFTLEVDDIGTYQNLEFVFIEIHKKNIPFFIEKLSIRSDESLLVKLEDVDNPEKAQEFIGRALYLPVGMLPELEKEAFYFHEIKGYEVIDANKGSLGTVGDVIEHPLQHLIQILKGEKEILIPLADEIIKKVDKKKRKIWIEAPEGLTDINN